MLKTGHDLVAVILFLVLLAMLSAFVWIYLTILAFYNPSA